jgi:hypothetical protein
MGPDREKRGGPGGASCTYCLDERREVLCDRRPLWSRGECVRADSSPAGTPLSSTLPVMRAGSCLEMRTVDEHGRGLMKYQRTALASGSLTLPLDSSKNWTH